MHTANKLDYTYSYANTIISKTTILKKCPSLNFPFYFHEINVDYRLKRAYIITLIDI